MSFFDQPYYAVVKANMSRVGLWPEQSTFVRTVRPLMIFAIITTIAAPMIIRLLETWRDVNRLIYTLPQGVVMIAIFITSLTCIINFNKIQLSFKNIEEHWKMFNNTSVVIVLDNYAECGRYMIIMYTMYTYISLIIFLVLCVSPIILDIVNPLNETRPRIHIFDTEYGVDEDKYYCFILVHEYIMTIMATNLMIAMETMYFLWAFHACALFEVVGYNLRLVSHKYTANKENEITLQTDWNYKQICECIAIHKVAISFADLIESVCNVNSVTVLGALAIMIIFTSIGALINIKHPEVLMQLAIFMIVQIFHVYINCIPGQQLMDHSQKIHTTVYNLEWQDMSVKAQKLLIPMLMRSSKPCCLTARKVYILSLEIFSTMMRTVISYFTIFVQLIK